ncbi:Serine hydroxymethyltransferase [Limihaloglobus sulfuriphilus]|uniref:Serine hydroxymethyltransferase n=1 Tax=Limihaloglobus sulfuriphilus TaxID=1851148 RepID=A0A1Q2MD59_9BACT|nr:serine hydroxymethyltransferase [Limihaloglobus sulfuriphilus]AQQ70589.1 Serine hydroxymethyltransferase [Limihaloglobus sulfuriphilus]
MLTALEQYDPQICELIKQEKARQAGCIRMIPSENYVSKAVMTATGSCLTNKYAEGYPGKRYYEGQQITDLIEDIARQRAVKVFGSDHANVQPYSGSIANMAAYMALVKPGETIMGLSLPDGGHLTHGWKVSATGKLFNSVQYTVNPETGRFDYDQIAELAKKNKPKIIISGATAYTREIDFKAFSEIAKSVGAYLISDIAHIAGLVVGGVHQSPVPYADIVSTTTHKTLRGPRGGMLLCKDEHKIAVDRAVFPGMQGGPHLHTITALAVALAEADTPEFKLYAKQVVSNAGVLAEKLMEYGFELVSGGTDNHLILIDMRNKGIPGKKMAKALDRAGIVTNCNTVPADPAPPFNPSGVRIGTPAVTTRGMKEEQMIEIAKLYKEVAENIDDTETIEKIGKKVKLLCSEFPIPDHFIVS